jgi:hypothetical protein
LNLMEDILSIRNKCSLSAITHKLNVCGHMLIWTFYLVLARGTWAQSLSEDVTYTRYIYIYNYTYTYTFHLLYTELDVALIQTKICESFSHNKNGCDTPALYSI